MKLLYLNVYKYRYSLVREWNKNKGKVLFIMLNPSTADDKEDDKTIIRCINFTKGLGLRWINGR